MVVSFLGALGCVMVMHFGGNAMFFWNSNFAQACCALLIIVAALLGLSIAASLFAPKKEPEETGGT